MEKGLQLSIKAGGKTYIEAPNSVLLFNRTVVFVLAFLYFVFCLIIGLLSFVTSYISESA